MLLSRVQLWLRQLYKEFNGELKDPTTIFEDNQAAIKLAKNPQYHGRTKHISIKYHFVREQVSNGTIQLKYCQTDEMTADMFTKGLAKAKFAKLREKAGIKDITVYE